MSEADGEVPAELARLWRLTSGSPLGRPAELDVEKVVRAAVELADRDGIDGVSMAKIARRLGVSTMALYHHVGSKYQLLKLMQDLANGDPPPLDTDPGDWRDRLRQWARAQRMVYHQHPWLAYLPITAPPLGPHQVRWMETALTALSDTDLDWGEKLAVLGLLGGYVWQASRLATDLERSRAESSLDEATAQRSYGRALATLLDNEQFPETTKLLASGILGRMPPGPSYAPADEPGFAFGLERLLDGIAATAECA